MWLVGFRPFFPLAGVAGAVLPVMWVLTLGGVISAPSISPFQWHAHEMFFGFGMAVLGGFLLTATKNWVQVRGHHGHALQVLVAAWLLERIALWWGGTWPRPLFVLGSHLFLATLVALLVWTLVRHRAKDSYPDNFIFMVVLPLFIVAKALVLDAQYFILGRELTLGLFRMAFLVMLERTLPPFMKGAFQVVLPRVFVVDTAIKGLGLLLVLGPWLPQTFRGALSFGLAALVLGRFVMWSPHRAFTRLDIAVMYLGGAALAAQLIMEGLAALISWSWPFSMSIHIFTFGTMGLIIPTMMTRIAKGHTGRPIVFDRFDKTALWLMLIGFVFRVLIPQVWPSHYAVWLWVSAGCWSACFALVTARITPLALRPRLDGKEH